MNRPDVLSLVFEQSTDGLLLLADGVFIDCNPTVLSLLGCSDKSEVLGKRPSDFSPEYQPDGSRSEVRQQEIIDAALQQGSICFEWTHCRTDGTLLPLEILMIVIEHDDRQILYSNWRDITRRRMAEKALAYRRRLESLITHTSSYFINLPTGEIDSGIEQVLGDLGHFVEADRSYVFAYEDGLMHNRYEWCADGIEPQIARMQNIPIHAMAWSNDRIMQGKILNVPDISALPEEAQPEGEEFTVQEIQSVLVVPMERRGQVVGFIGFDAVREQRHWPEESVDLLRIAAGIIANVMDRHHAELQLKELNHTLKARVAERTREVEQRRRIAEGLRDSLAALNTDKAYPDLLDFIIQQAVDLLGTGGGALYLLDDAQKMLHVGAAVGLDAEYTVLELPVGTVVTGRAVAFGEPVSVPDMQAASQLLQGYLKDPSVPEGWQEGLQKLLRQYNAVLSVPVQTRTRIYGAMTLYYPQSQQFTDDVIGLAVAFAGQAGLVIENSHLRERVRETAALEERSRLARDLHDAVTQTLFSASLIADTLPDLWGIDRADAEQQLKRLGLLTRGALAEMRMLLIELRPARLVEADIATLFEQLTEAAQGRSKIDISLNIQGQGSVEADTKIVFYRIAQEALHNIIKHAQADHAFISLRFNQAQITLQILDDGCGFDANTIPHGHFGLQIMKERAASIGATFVVDSSPNEGTDIQVIWRRYG